LQGYNPRKRGGMTHHPVLAGLAECRVILHGWLRSGNATSGDNVVAFLAECLGLAKGRVTLSYLRADSGFFDKRILDFLEDRHLLYIVKAPFTNYRSYLPRGEFENRIKELKQGCGLNGFCMEDFSATESVLRVLCLVHNLIQVFQDKIGMRPADRPKREGERHTLETLRNTLFTCAAVLGWRGRQVVLRLSTTETWLGRFEQALARLLPAPANCRAVLDSATRKGIPQPALPFDG